MDLATHRAISEELCGRVTEIGGGTAVVVLKTTAAMAVDEQQLVHGGFVFGLADHAAMVAVNHPWVVLAGADSHFLKPTRVGESLIARATSDRDPRRPQVEVEVESEGQVVARFVMRCAVLERHVLAGVGS